MSKFLHADCDNAKAITILKIFSENSRAKNGLFLEKKHYVTAMDIHVGQIAVFPMPYNPKSDWPTYLSQYQIIQIKDISFCLTHYQTTNLRLPIADDNLKFEENGRNLFKQVENTVEKGEFARYEQFLLFPQCFQKACFLEALKSVIVRE